MGPCLSYHLNCPKCKYYKAEYVYKDNENPRIIPQLMLWFNDSFLYRALYISCHKCLPDIPDQYRDNFEYKMS